MMNNPHLPSLILDDSAWTYFNVQTGKPAFFKNSQRFKGVLVSQKGGEMKLLLMVVNKHICLYSEAILRLMEKEKLLQVDLAGATKIILAQDLSFAEVEEVSVEYNSPCENNLVKILRTLNPSMEIHCQNLPVLTQKEKDKFHRTWTVPEIRLIMAKTIIKKAESS